jgi:hypothetical protein
MIFKAPSMDARKDLTTPIFLTVSAFSIGVIPWIFLLFGATKNSVRWMGRLGFQYWGWFLVFCLAGYASVKTLRLKTPYKVARMTIGAFSLILLVWSVLWALLIVCGMSISTIV